jgi:hypothetical protein
LLFQVEHDSYKVGELINKFWEEFDYFHSKSGPFDNRDHIWVSGDIRSGHSHIWHSKNSLRYTKIFGQLACRVCSKILGIGSAERAWGDVKHLKTNKRSHIGGERVKKQATIYGSHCVTLANLERAYKPEDYKNKPYKFWMEEDMDKEFDLFVTETTKAPKARRTFIAYEEEWEEAATKKKDPVNEAKLLQKYGGLQWYDMDTKKTFYANSTEVRWIKEPRKAGMYCVIGYDEDYEEGKVDEEDDEHVEYWQITEDLRYCISEHYKTKPNGDIKIITVEASDDESEQESE